MIRQDACSPTPVRIMDEVVEPALDDSSCATESVRDRLQIMKAKLEFHGERLQGGVGRCSEKLSEGWYSSRIVQWAEKHREQKNAPPPPKFHPIPTHPAFFPERDDPNLTVETQGLVHETLE